jgi:TPR repeat protein
VKDYAAAREHWLRASEAGEVSALNNLGYLLYYGLGGEPDQDRAVTLWKRAALLGHSEAQWHLGHAFEGGEGVPRSEIEAYAWYRCAVESAEGAPAEEKEVESQIARDARKSLTSLLAKLAPDQLGAAEQLARRYIENYAKRGT